MNSSIYKVTTFYKFIGFKIGLKQTLMLFSNLFTTDRYSMTYTWGVTRFFFIIITPLIVMVGPRPMLSKTPTLPT